MDRQKFAREFYRVSEHLDKKRLKTLIKESLIGREKEVLVICMEELAELQQEISKIFRGKTSRIGLIEEIGDVILLLESIKEICDISTLEVNRAMNVKLGRLDQIVRERRRKKNEQTAETGDGET